MATVSSFDFIRGGIGGSLNREMVEELKYRPDKVRTLIYVKSRSLEKMVDHEGLGLPLHRSTPEFNKLAKRSVIDYRIH